MGKRRFIQVGVLLFFAALIGLGVVKLYGHLMKGQWMLSGVGTTVLAAFIAMFWDLAQRLEW